MCHHWCRQSYSLGPLLSELALGRHSGGECSQETTKHHNISNHQLILHLTGNKVSMQGRSDQQLKVKLALVISAVIDNWSNLADSSFNPMEDTVFYKK